MVWLLAKRPLRVRVDHEGNPQENRREGEGISGKRPEGERRQRGTTRCRRDPRLEPRRLASQHGSATTATWAATTTSTTTRSDAAEQSAERRAGSSRAARSSWEPEQLIDRQFFLRRNEKRSATRDKGFVWPFS